MNFDPNIRVADIILLLGFFGSICGLWLSQRDKVVKVNARVDLMEQAHDFLKQQRDDDRKRSDSHWQEVKDMLKTIYDKLDDKADKP